MATKKPTGTAVVPWEEEMKSSLVKQVANAKSTGVRRIAIQGGILSVDDAPVEGNELNVIVLGAVHENQYYTQEYDPDHPTVPACYALGDPEAEDQEEGMAPHAEAEDPQGDDDNMCAGCEHNQFGSAEKGRGKACKNIRRLMLLTEDAVDSAADLKSAEHRMLKVPVMSAKLWSNYVRDVLGTQVERPYFGVVTKIKIVPDRKSQFLITFAFERLIEFDQELWQTMKAKVAAANKALTEPYPKQAELDAMQAEAKPVKVHGKMASKMAKPVPAKKVAGKVVPAKKAVARR